MNRIAWATATLTMALGSFAWAQSPPPQGAQQPTPSSEAQGSRDQGPAPSTSAKPGARDPSSTRGRPDASYPNPSGQDTKTDAAARRHTEKGHDDAKDANVPQSSRSAGPTEQQEAYTARSGKKPNAETPCTPPRNRPINPGAASELTKCEETKPADQSRRANAPPPGATAPMHNR